MDRHAPVADCSWRRPSPRLVTLTFTDVVGSTALAARLGDAAWDELLATHYENARTELERFGGHEVATTGDRILATFSGPAAALECAEAITRGARAHGLHFRAGVHTGEVELVGDDVRGVAVHEAARIKEQAHADEVLVSETTKALAAASGPEFEDRGVHQLKGLEGERRLSRWCRNLDKVEERAAREVPDRH
jgi:class 3 adenylate cyclase